jgi:hypothetical protein
VSGWSRLFDQAITVSSVCGLNSRVSTHVSGLAILKRVHCALHEVSQLHRLFGTPTWQTPLPSPGNATRCLHDDQENRSVYPAALAVGCIHVS